MRKLLEQVDERLQDTKPSTLILSTTGIICLGYLINKLVTHPLGIRGAIESVLFSLVKHIPGAEEKIAEETEKLAAKVAEEIPHIDDPRHVTIPEKGIPYEDLIKRLQYLKEQEDKARNRVSGTIYIGPKIRPNHTELLCKAYEMFIHSNPLHTSTFPSTRKMEAEVIRMTASMLGGDEKVVGTLTSGGTESILMAVKTYRDQARVLKPYIKNPEIIVPNTAHAAFEKACQYFNITMVGVDVDTKTFTVNPSDVEKKITKNTIAIVGSAPCYSTGTIDPITELGKLAEKYNIGLHVDCCLGGFFLPWAKMINKNIPDFDFRVKGVTSISADTHKYGFASKGSSVILYRNKELRKYQYFITPTWTGGIYATPTISGSRPGALVATCWAALLHFGQDGYIESTRQILQSVEIIKKGVQEIDGIELMGEGLAMVVAIQSASPNIDIFMVMDAMKHRGWECNAILYPSGFHFCVTQLHVGDVAHQFVKDLKESVEEVKKSPEKFAKGLAPIYSQAVRIPDKTPIKDFVTAYFDKILDY